MKKVFSILALVLAMTLMLSLPAFAVDQAFTVGENSSTTVTATGAADSIDVAVSAASAGAYYGVLLVEGSDLPTVDTPIYYINQASSAVVTEATDDAEATYGVDFTVLPIIPTADTEMTLYVSSTEADLVSIPVNFTAYAEDVPANDYITSADTAKGTIKTDVASVTDASMGAAVGNAIIQLALDTTAYPNAGNAAAGYIVKAVNADGTAIDGAAVYYSAERAKYVALIPTTATDYKFEVIAADAEGATANAVISKYGNMNEDAAGAINVLDNAQFAKVYKKAADAASVTDAKKALIADVTGDGRVNVLDNAQFIKAYKKQTYTFAVLSK